MNWTFQCYVRGPFKTNWLITVNQTERVLLRTNQWIALCNLSYKSLKELNFPKKHLEKRTVLDKHIQWNESDLREMTIYDELIHSGKMYLILSLLLVSYSQFYWAHFCFTLFLYPCLSHFLLSLSLSLSDWWAVSCGIPHLLKVQTSLKMSVPATLWISHGHLLTVSSDSVSEKTDWWGMSPGRWMLCKESRKMDEWERCEERWIDVSTVKHVTSHVWGASVLTESKTPN